MFTGIDTLRELCALPGVSGDEGAVRNYITNFAFEHTDNIAGDFLGNLFVSKRIRYSGKKIMLFAHMDEVGVIATGITDAGYIKFACVGGVDKRVLPGKRVEFGAARVPGVIGVKPSHLVKKPEREKAADVNDMYIDVGASSKEDAAKLVRLGDTGVFAPDGGAAAALEGGYIRAKAIDDRFGCAVMLKLLESDLPVDCTFVFTAQEEVGTRGAAVAANREKPDIALVIEATTAADIPNVPEGKTVCKLGGGAVIPFMDGSTIYDRELWKLLAETADERGIPWQTKEYIAGGTDAAAIQRSGAGVRTVGIAAPVRNLHTPSCVAKISDMEAVYALAAAFLEKL